MPRAQMLVLALLVINLLLGVLCLVIARGEHRSPALRWWGWGLLVYAAGLMVTIASPLIGKASSATLGNTLITIAPILCALAVFSHTHFRLNWTYTWTGVALTVAALAYNNFTPYSTPLVNLIAPTVMAVTLVVIATVVILRDGPRDARAACGFLAAMSVISILTWLVRIVFMVAAIGPSADVSRADLVISLFAIAQMVNSIGAALSLMWIDVRLMQAELSRVAHSDALTGLPNRRGILHRFEAELSRASRHGQGFAMAVFDVDHFKVVNDEHGHIAGDLVLKSVADAFAAAKRNEDVLGRIGGEEFLFLLPQQDRERACEAVERLREAAGRTDIEYEGRKIRVTVSGGLAMYPGDGADWDTLFAAADRRLYVAKKAGRNRVEWRPLESVEFQTA